jgi:hypothetical protein
VLWHFIQKKTKKIWSSNLVQKWTGSNYFVKFGLGLVNVLGNWLFQFGILFPAFALEVDGFPIADYNFQ